LAIYDDIFSAYSQKNAIKQETRAVDHANLNKNRIKYFPKIVKWFLDKKCGGIDKSERLSKSIKIKTILTSIFILTGCGSILSDQNLMETSKSSPAIAPGLRFGDQKPHAWGRKKPKNYPVHGIDVAKYQNRIDWRQVKQAGIEFVFIKATEGGDRLDERFAENWQKTKMVGLPRGAYHFYYFCRPAAEQAAWFIANVPKEADALPPVLDMEWNHLSPTCKLRPSADIVRREMQIFLSMVERHYGKKAIIYTTVDFFDRNGLSEFKNNSFWLRSVAGHPNEKYGNHPWVFWQYTGTGIIPGIETATDINVFSGNRREWENWKTRN